MRSEAEPRDAQNALKFHPRRSRPRRSAPLCALNPVATMEKAGERAGCASRGGVLGSGAPPEDAM
eukprot:13101547-Alexandrium_andersonii.AAC.1